MNVVRAAVPRPLERRLLIAYLGAFAVVIALFALALRFVFFETLQTQITARLDTLARAGTASVTFTPHGFIVDQESLGGFSVVPRTEGLQWYDETEHLVATRGLVPPGPLAPTEGRETFHIAGGTLDTYTVELEVPGTGRSRGWVRASESEDTLTASSKALDIAIASGALLAIIVGAYGGSRLARVAVERDEASMSRLREFTADAAHELRAPVSALAGTADVALREEPDLPLRTQRRLHAIHEIADDMRRLVDDLLILARATQSLEREIFVIDLRDMLDRLQGRFTKPARERDIAFRIAPSDPMRIYGNPDQIERIVANLVDNAIKYTERGGSVAIACASDETRLWITVRDSGIGIAPEHRERVFDRFWRADPARASESGTGLGLAIARALARRHGGDIAVVSELGRGSTFTLTLPRRPPALS
ncbi:MAG TPA: HAMP domain-containing sensor histidine kinase [Candidatus Sulfotelmatobacter sp.]|nr:HAMP domain-containing sensor histidine kinase [Candidatus Sulfotelmatobacter sp.]